MSAGATRFFPVFLVGLATAPSLAHLLELPNKIDLSYEQYAIVQRLYDGWAWLGILVYLALAGTLILCVAVRRQRAAFVAALLALLALIAAQAIFWAFTFPANKATQDWTVLPPEGWQALRAQWEYSHAASAVFMLLALAAVIVAAIRDK